MARNTVQSVGNSTYTLTHPLLNSGQAVNVTGIKLETQYLKARQQVDNSKVVLLVDGSAITLTNVARSGQVTLNVVDNGDTVANGNLVVRGEKQMALSEGSEIIQVAGVIRPEDVSPNNSVLSTRLANAQITYRGTGDMAAATRAGWGTSALLKLWPF